jgi:hypothetical protein
MLKGLAAFATTFVLSTIALSGWADAGQREANKISNLGYRHGHYYERYRDPPNYGFDDYFRPFGGSYGGYYGGYFGAGSDSGFAGYNPCGLGRSVLEGCRPYRGY